MSEVDFSQHLFPKWDQPPKRLISLVPSITESLFELGFGDRIVGITDYCTRPKHLLGNLVRVGGPKTPKIDVIKGLEPDLIIANREETQQKVIERLAAEGYSIWLIFPKSVEDSMNLLRQFLALFHSDQLVAKVNSLQIGVDYARLAGSSDSPTTYFCPIWYGQEDGMDWWMTFNKETYPDDLLRMFGGLNVFAERERLYPIAADLGKGKAEPAAGRDTRYPRVSVGEVIAAQPELILLPDEPYAFSEEDKQLIIYALSDTPAVRQEKIYLFDGSLLTWYGVRLAKALQFFPEIFYPSIS